MPEETNENKEPLVLLGSFPLDDAAGAEEEKIDSLWRQMMVYKAFEQDLSEARARRVEAEAVRDRAEHESYQAAHALTQQMRSEAERELNEAKEQRQQATKANQEAQENSALAKDTADHAQKERDHIIEEAKKQAQEITEQARANAHHEITELRRQALKEIKAVLNRVENMRAAANEELETQRILSNVAKLKATTKWETSEDQSEEEWNASQQESPSSNAPVSAAAPQPVETNAGSEAEQSPAKGNAKKSEKS